MTNLLFNDNPQITKYGAKKGYTCLRCNLLQLRTLSHETNDTNNEITVCALAVLDKKIIKKTDRHDANSKACGRWQDRFYLPI